MSRFERMKLAVKENDDKEIVKIMAEEISDFCDRIGVAPVVRCKDCKKRHTDDCPMFHKSSFLEKQATRFGLSDNENDFCSYGMRKEKEG